MARLKVGRQFSVFIG
jgi:hypothetical protein